MTHRYPSHAVNPEPASFRRSVPGQSAFAVRPVASICAGIVENVHDRPQDNIQVKPHRPLFDIFDVIFNPLPQLLGRVEFAPQSADLRQASKTRFDTMAGGGTVDEVIEPLPPCPCLQSMRPRADDGHRALQDVEKLRELVYAHVAKAKA